MSELGAGSVEVKYRLGDIYAVSFRSWRSWLRSFLVLEVLLFAIAIGFPMTDGFSFSDAVSSIDWFLPLLGIVVFVILMTISAPISYFRAYRRGFLGPIQLSLDEHGVSIESSKGESVVYWSAVTRVTVSRRRLFLFISPALAYILPRRCFIDGSEFDRFVEVSKQRWAEARSPS